jgi:AGCS family alanine or glycine:cation symporter
MRLKRNPLLGVTPFLLVLAILVSVAYSQSTKTASEPKATETAPAETTSEADQADKPAKELTWMDGVDNFFGTYFVTPMSKVLFYDFGTANWQKNRLEKQDTDGDGRISRDEAQGKLAAGFDDLDKDEDGFLSEEEYAVLAPAIPFVVAWLLAGGVFFTLRMSFINIRGFWHAIRLTKGDYDDEHETGEVSHFQALSSALSATVGLGNIAGVAIAVGAGGPGAIFWLILAGLVGMTSKFTECTLGQMYRKVSADGTVSGGPMHYLRDGLKEMGLGPIGVVLAIVYAIICMGASFGGGCAFQVGQSLGPIREKITLLDSAPWIYGLVMAAMVGVVIIGGIRRIAATASKIVPLMCTIYVIMALIVLGANIEQIPGAIKMIFANAFTGNAAWGGFLGVAVIGIKRAVFSNEAGIGSASIAHAAAKTDEPVSEGIVALLEPFIDTVVVCTMTGLVIVITGVYDMPQYKDLVVNDEGAALTARALESVSSVFPWVLCVAVFLFAYSTMISWSYYGERCWSLLFGTRTAMVYKMLFLCFVFLGSIITANNVKDFSDLMILSLAFPNILGVAILSGKVRRALDDYWGRYKAGEFDKQATKKGNIE